MPPAAAEVVGHGTVKSYEPEPVPFFTVVLDDARLMDDDSRLRTSVPAKRHAHMNRSQFSGGTPVQRQGTRPDQRAVVTNVQQCCSGSGSEIDGSAGIDEHSLREGHQPALPESHVQGPAADDRKDFGSEVSAMRPV